MNASTLAAIAKFLAEARKAYAAGLAAATAVLGPKLLAGTATQTDYELAIGAALFAAAVVFFVKNQPKTAPAPAAPVAPVTPTPPSTPPAA